jgi:glycosyltransferase involved in cell wall biosynthesis
MQLTVVWHKLCWPCAGSPTGFAARACLGDPGFGGLPLQIEALSQLFDATRIVGPCSGPEDRAGEIALAGKNVTVVPLSWLPRSPWLTWLVLPFWLVRNGRTLTREISGADAVSVLIPSPIGVLGLLLALVFRKRLLTRQLNHWSDPRLLWRLERALLVRIGGGRNVVFATGDSDEPPSPRNRSIRWIIGTTVGEDQLTTSPRTMSPGQARLVMVARELDIEGVSLVLRALLLLGRDYREVRLDVVGIGTALSELERLASRLDLVKRVGFHGLAGHGQVQTLLDRADLFCSLPLLEDEAFRQSIHEALARGLPLVTTGTSIPPILAGRSCGILLREKSPPAFAAAVKACLSDPQAYGSMSAEALRRAKGYTLECWREEIRNAVEAAWGPLETKLHGAPVMAGGEAC